MNRYTCLVGIEVYTYPYSTGKEKVKLHTVDADSEMDAEIKIKNFYRSESDLYGTSYRVQYVEFSEHIV